MQRLPARILLFRHIFTNALMRIAMPLALLVPISHLRLIQPKITPLRPFEAPGAASDNHRYEAPGPRIQKIRALFLLSGGRDIAGNPPLIKKPTTTYPPKQSNDRTEKVRHERKRKAR